MSAKELLDKAVEVMARPDDDHTVTPPSVGKLSTAEQYRKLAELALQIENNEFYRNGVNVAGAGLSANPLISPEG